MAVNETIVTGRKFRKCVDVANKLWQRISFWTKSSDVEFDDGKTAETKVGAIDGITSDLSGESETVAASIKCVNQLNSSLNNIKNFPDFSDIIDSTSLKTYNAQYTAAQDCYICGSFKSNSGSVFAHIYVDNVSVASTNLTGFISVLIPVGKGSVVKTRDANNTVYDLTVYGVK